MINYIQSSFKDNQDMLKLYEYVEDNVYEHQNSSTDYISTSDLPFPMDIIDVEKWNKLYNYRDDKYVALFKFCIDKGYPPYIYGLLTSTSQSYFSRPVKIENGLINYGVDNPHQIWTERIIFKEDADRINSYHVDYVNSFIDRLSKWNKIAIKREFKEQMYIDHFIERDLALNRLRSLLKSLVKDSLELYRRQIDEKESTERLIQYNHLLQKYCLQLIEHCQQYLEPKIKSQKVPISF
ncbi:hypothetical protein TVAG_374730 [Trichomonas vaginalis G3]|uniref:Uncharacterized protein n=1 Tax=Trichomonas vaginalis (strain ATCC PRA-98 / G3) TaxID=412133 RepID=A2FCI6_TRIV3|nr:hypothetical protein TVAGG3_0151450 [Trichomonas vaginalis G3]EAX97392.1 hypothetical protein TVAG_374730 [Trichomonas vaginalis G3]KAI5547294.1 hypothetical protein TVAGG3_0151450 [Trichomonas vaginalis G3]|eukprot:XP_001310322.1 hypothetical protein [Trichomonas vaginalis G3]